MSKYVDGFVAAVPMHNKGAYTEHAAIAAEVFRECGALSVVDCWGDDVPAGKITSFRSAVGLEGTEVVVFSWIVWPSREARLAGMARALSDPRLRDLPMPFDGSRALMGGFEMISEQ